MQLDRIAGRFAVAQLPAGEGWPHWFTWARGVSAIVRTAHETSIFCEEHLVPENVRAERGFVAYTVRGPLDFSAVGILARLSQALADAGIPLLALSTFDTDVILVRAERANDTEQAWRAAGMTVESGEPGAG